MKQISPAELHPGMFITVLDAKPFETSGSDRLMSDLFSVVTTTVDRTGMGDVLTVLAVDLPYITARIENRLDHHSRYSFVFDTRRTQFMELSREYVASICPHLTIVYESTNPPC